MVEAPWNHNTAFHRELVAAVPGPTARVLDIGCGGGVLVERLAAVAGGVVGIDLDEASVAAARERLAGTANVRLVEGDVLTSPALEPASFDLITCVSALHHLPLRRALVRMRELLAPGGRLRIVGLAASDGIRDRILSDLQVIPVRIIGLVRHEASDPRMIVEPPQESLATVRWVAREVLPGSRVRRRLYYRYSLDWTKPR